jgi:hypothetical protein
MQTALQHSDSRTNEHEWRMQPFLTYCFPVFFLSDLTGYPGWQGDNA